MAAEELDSYEELKVSELQEELEARKVSFPKRATKAKLIKLLEKDDVDNPDPEEDEEDADGEGEGAGEDNAGEESEDGNDKEDEDAGDEDTEDDEDAGDDEDADADDPEEDEEDENDQSDPKIRAAESSAVRLIDSLPGKPRGGSVDVVNEGGGRITYIRSYYEGIHGKGYKKLADGFADKMRRAHVAKQKASFGVDLKVKDVPIIVVPGGKIAALKVEYRKWNARTKEHVNVHKIFSGGNFREEALVLYKEVFAQDNTAAITAVR